jgi:type I restriction enzyme S subunit
VKAGWAVKSLGEISDFQGGSQPPKSNFVDQPREGYVRLLQIRDFKSDKWAVYVPIAKSNKLCQENDIMIGRYGASVGQIHRGKGGAYNVALIRTIPNLDLIDREFFYHYLNSDLFQKPLFSVADRSAQAGFSKDDIAPFLIPLPPLEEQRRIVAVLDKAFAGIATATANAEKNLTNARALLEGYRNATLAKSEQRWTSRSLGSVCDFLNGFAFKSTDTTTQSSVQLIRMGNLYQNKLDLARNPSYYPEAFSDTYARYKLDTGDLIISLTGTVDKEDYGFVVEIPFSQKTLLLNQRIAKFTNIDRSKTTKGYLLHLLRSRVFLDKLYASSRGTRQANLSTVTMKSMQLPFPPIEMQNKLVATFDLLGDQTTALALNYQRKLAALSELKQSLLQKAFAGELT